jgi:ribulose kinase
MIIEHDTPIVFDTENAKSGRKRALVIKSASIASFGVDCVIDRSSENGCASDTVAEVGSIREVPEVEKVCGRTTGKPEVIPQCPPSRVIGKFIL